MKNEGKGERRRMKEIGRKKEREEDNMESRKAGK